MISLQSKKLYQTNAGTFNQMIIMALIFYGKMQSLFIPTSKPLAVLCYSKALNSFNIQPIYTRYFHINLMS